MEELKLNLELNQIPFGRLIWVDLQLHQFYVVSDHLFVDEVVVHLPLDVWTVIEDIQGDLVGGCQVLLGTEADLVVKVVERSYAENSFILHDGENVEIEI